MHDLACLKPFCTSDEAAVLEAVLEEAGIQCEISEEAGGVWGFQVGSQGAARVMVAEEDLARAAEILKAHEAAMVAENSRGDSDGEEDPYWNAPEAFAPFEDKEPPSGPQPWMANVFGPFWILPFAVVLVLFGIGFYLLVSFLVGI